MLTSETKRHIDAARQVLVGVVPNPTSQIDQITNALIYKFMDDMDQSAIKAGGSPSFFTDDLEIYAWTRLMDSRLGNQERMNLYSEALIKFSQAKQLPELFRNIFKSAFLPYRSPEVLGLFLKEINYFDYSHPEDLGDGYEYLLSIMSSQGDAGQFRTPRHIIDFIIDAINPTKGDKILDPACGTGGFLVGSYKHILEQHDGKDDPNKKEKPLTPDDRKKLFQNFEGYDIDPGMVRIAQVNMYLHQFKNPKIFQYDALGMDERWNDKFDVILANPPFMSPKGGVRPHSKFSVQSSRSEVLFVDYIMNHLKPKGRAGVIVPEGIIFQSGSAHKQLRKNLVNDGLYAVVSLPSGVFQPYSGVKTSILLFNNELAKKTEDILFIKILNDGFDLGAQRRANNRNDLPHALKTLQAQDITIQTGSENSLLLENSLFAWTVSKSRIAENGDYNLSGDRYRTAVDYANSKWPIVELGEITEIRMGETLIKGDLTGNGRPIFSADTSDEPWAYSDKTKLSFGKKTIVIGARGTVGSIKLPQADDFTCTQTTIAVTVSKEVNEKYIYYQLKNFDFSSIKEGVGIPMITVKAVSKIKVPLPPLEIQEKIVAELDGYAGIIAGAKQIVDNWKPKIDIDPEWEKVKLGDVCDIFGGGTPPRTEEKYWGGNIPWLSARYFSNDHRIKGCEMITEQGLKNSSSKIAPKGSTILITRVSVGKFAIADQDYAINQDLTALVSKGKNLDPQYLWLITEIVAERVKDSAIGVGVTGVTRDFVINQEIPLPPLEIQKQIVEKIEAERALVESAKKLIDIYEEKTKETIAKLWEE